MTRTWLALLTGLGIGAAALTGCGQDADQAATTTPPSIVTPSPRPAADAATGDRAYLRLLGDGGWTVNDQAQIIRVAHAECGIRSRGTSTADLVGQVARKYGVTADAALIQITSAEVAYCRDYLEH
jgi:hypothetical protein